MNSFVTDFVFEDLKMLRSLTHKYYPIISKFARDTASPGNRRLVGDALRDLFSRGKYYVINGNGYVHGYIGIYSGDNIKIFIRPESRGKKVALTALTELVKRYKYKTLYYQCLRDNTASIKLVESTRLFERVGLKDRLFGDKLIKVETYKTK